jgi:ketosteroid isomerase-like protein
MAPGGGNSEVTTTGMKKTLGLVVCLAALISSGCVEPRDPKADERAIAEVRQRALAALNAGDLETLLSVLSEDIVLTQPQGVTLVGYGPVADHLRGFFSRADLDVTRKEQRLVLADEWAFDHSLLSGTWTARAGGDPQAINARASDILKLQWDDSWKYTRLMGLPSLEEVHRDGGASDETAAE